MRLLDENGNPVRLYEGRMGFRVHVPSYSLAMIGAKYAICSASLAFKTRPNAHLEVAEERMCPRCLKRAEQKGYTVVRN